MFEGADLYMDAMLGILMIEKIRYDHTGTITGIPLQEDYLWEVYYEALDDVADSVSGILANEDVNIQKFSFPGMKEFYCLCREYGRKNRVSFKNNRYAREAADFVNREMNGIDSYCINWRLFTPKKVTDKKWPCLAVFTDVEFYQPVQVGEALYNIRTCHKQALEKLKEELRPPRAELLLPPELSRAAERNAG